MADLVGHRQQTRAGAEYLGHAESTPEKKRITGEGPPLIRLGRAVVYDPRDLDAWLAARRATSTSERRIVSLTCRQSNARRRWGAPVRQREIVEGSRPKYRVAWVLLDPAASAHDVLFEMQPFVGAWPARREV